MSGLDESKRENELAQIALEKLVRVLGETRGRRVFAEALAGLRLSELATAQDLYEVGKFVSGKGGMEAAVGGLISVAAVVRGATPR